jgi:hypothetical protein
LRFWGKGCRSNDMTPAMREDWERERAAQWVRVKDQQAALWEKLLRPVKWEGEGEGGANA